MECVALAGASSQGRNAKRENAARRAEHVRDDAQPRTRTSRTRQHRPSPQALGFFLSLCCLSFRLLCRGEPSSAFARRDGRDESHRLARPTPRSWCSWVHRRTREIEPVLPYVPWSSTESEIRKSSLLRGRLATRRSVDGRSQDLHRCAHCARLGNARNTQLPERLQCHIEPEAR